MDETAALIYEKYNTQNKSETALVYEARVLKALAYKGVKELGTIDKNKIQRVGDIYNLLGLIRNKIDLDSFVYTAPKNYSFTSKEKKYLQDKKVIKMCVDPNWMPLESLQGGKHIGMSADYFQLVQEMLSIDIKVLQSESWDDSIKFAKNRKCDIMSLVMPTPEREKYLKFTDPYLKIPLVMATKIDAPFVADFYSLSNKKIGITKGYAFLELLRVKYPNLQIVEVENIQDGLNKVTNGSLYGYIGTLASIGYSFQKNFTGELKVAGKFDGTWDLAIGVRNDDPVLFDILQKVVGSIDENQKQQIFNNWLSIKYDKNIDYHLLIKIVLGFIAVLLLIFYFYLRERKLKNDLELNHILLEAIMNNIPNPMFYKDKFGVYQNVNDAFTKGILGFDKEFIRGKTLYDLKEYIPDNLAKIYQEQDKELYASGKPQDYETKVKVSDGTLKDFRINKSIFYSDEHQLLGYVAIMSDITELKEKERKLEELASVDPLSKLYNRRYFSQTAEDIFKLAVREKFSLSVVMMDIDNFKHINDTYGHETGDDVIVALSEKLQNLSRTSDIACRFGGEEFIMLLPHTNINGALIIAEKIRVAISEIKLYPIDNHELQFTVSVGVAEVVIEVENNIEAAIKRADDALYEAKLSGKNRVCKA
jgi:diguanylate cyclase (GGDEF)-like protein/PAS domain S-box-containing protein